MRTLHGEAVDVVSFHDVSAYWPLRWRDQHGLSHYSDGVVTRCRMETPYEDLRRGTSWKLTTPTGLPQDVITCMRCLGWTPRP